MHLGEEMAQALPPTADGQQLQVEAGVPAVGQTGLGEGAVEGAAMALQLGFRQGAIHIPEHGLRQGGHRRPRRGSRVFRLRAGRPRRAPHNGATWPLSVAPPAP